MEKLKRYLIFLVGLFVNSLGVSLITKANLGTSPISSIPYVLSLNFPFTLGNFTIFFSIFLIVLQLIILRKNFKLEHILQIPVSIIFGYFIDLTMILFSWVNPEAYIMKIVYLLIGCLILGVGVYMEVLADVVMLPGESFVRAIVLTWKTNFGTTKICFDVSMSVIAAVLSFVFAGRLAGVREGTVIAALLVGFIARLIGKKLVFLKDMIFPESVSAENENEAKEQTAGTYGKNVIAIGRQFGSGGHDIGKILAEKLGYDFYDAEIIQMTAGTTGYTPEFIKKNEEIMTNSLIYDLVNQMYLNADMQDEAPKDKIFEAECQVVRNLAKKGNCVIVGRCADYVLRNSGNCLKVFFSAPLMSRIRRVAQRQNISEGEAKATVQKNEKLRADNYRYYTRRMWGAAGNFDLSLNTDLGEEYIENCIRSAMKL
ncbi:MAG: cytidylate kinase family protein [Blautia massiliensis (ex Durand et al. 2017)]